MVSDNFYRVSVWFYPILMRFDAGFCSIIIGSIVTNQWFIAKTTNKIRKNSAFIVRFIN